MMLINTCMVWGALYSTCFCFTFIFGLISSKYLTLIGMAPGWYEIWVVLGMNESRQWEEKAFDSVRAALERITGPSAGVMDTSQSIISWRHNTVHRYCDLYSLLTNGRYINALEPPSPVSCHIFYSLSSFTN